MRQDDFPSSTSEDLLQDMKGGAASPEDIKEDRKDDENVDDTPHTFGFNDDAVCEHGKSHICIFAIYLYLIFTTSNFGCRGIC